MDQAKLLKGLGNKRGFQTVVLITTKRQLLKNVSELYAYSFWKVCHPVQLLKTVRLLETLEYVVEWQK